jgi:carotenoid cleavage dioxygenase-like enzyme
MNARYVETPVRKWEERFGRPLFRGAMSAVADMKSGKLSDRLANALSPTTRETANLAVRKWGDRLIVTADNCSFYGMCSDTLDTLGVDTFDNVLQGYQMLAHTRTDTERNRLVACALAYQPFEQSTDLTFFEFDKDGKLVSKVEHHLPAFVTHDWTITPNYYVIPAASAVFDTSKLPSLIAGGMTATEIFAIDANAPGTVLLIPRDGSGPPIRAERSDGMHSTIFHVGPTYEDDETGDVIFHPFCFDQYQFGGEMGFDIHKQSFDPTPWSESNGGPKLERWTIDMTESKVKGKGKVVPAIAERLSTVISDMPTFHPDRDGLECNSVYTVCGIREEGKGWFPFNSIAKHDLRTGECEVWPPEACSLNADERFRWDGGSAVRAEPLFVPRVGAIDEDDGYVLSTVHCSENRRTTLEILDAKDFGAGPIQRIDLGELMGWNVHSSFDPAGANV